MVLNLRKTPLSTWLRLLRLSTAVWLAHVDERRTTVQEVGVQDPGQTHTQGLKITEENVLPLPWCLQAVTLGILVFSDKDEKPLVPSPASSSNY